MKTRTKSIGLCLVACALLLATGCSSSSTTTTPGAQNGRGPGMMGGSTVPAPAPGMMRGSTGATGTGY